jgi:hypothetical protein
VSLDLITRVNEGSLLGSSHPGIAKVTAVEKRGDQYQVIALISPKYRGSFNTLAFSEIKPPEGRKLLRQTPAPEACRLADDFDI